MFQLKNKKAFTLVELLIVIAIIGILFIVLVSKVDFATDKAKTTGVQTDFRSFQMALETVSREQAGFNTFGWDRGDLNANNVIDIGEVWNGDYALSKPGEEEFDVDAVSALENEINKYLDDALELSVNVDGTISMKFSYKDPWGVEYHGFYLTEVGDDNCLDRGAIVIYSNGADMTFGSSHSINNGLITVTAETEAGKDDYFMATVYSYHDGWKVVTTVTEGFSSNQTLTN